MAIDNIPIIDYIEKLSTMFSKSTNARLLSYKKSALLLSLDNIFSPINQITIKDNGKLRKVDLKYTKAIPGYFGGAKLNVFNYISEHLFDSI